jgi:hypothetical protein
MTAAVVVAILAVASGVAGNMLAAALQSTWPALARPSGRVIVVLAVMAIVVTAAAGVTALPDDEAEPPASSAPPATDPERCVALETNAEVVSEITFGEEARLVYAQPHMHLRGKDFELRVVTPDKKTTTVLKGNWNFEWQMGYQYAEPVALPKGSKLQFITHFDNSTANRFNPDPKAQVLWGPQNWDEMSNCFIGVLFDKNTAPEKVFLRSGPSLLKRGESGPTMEAFNRAEAGAPTAAANATLGTAEK